MRKAVPSSSPSDLPGEEQPDGRQNAAAQRVGRVERDGFHRFPYFRECRSFSHERAAPVLANIFACLLAECMSPESGKPRHRLLTSCQRRCGRNPR